MKKREAYITGGTYRLCGLFYAYGQNTDHKDKISLMKLYCMVSTDREANRQ